MDKLTLAQRRHAMSRVKSKNTSPELLVRKLLHAHGYRFRLHRDDLPGKPDIVLPRYGAVVLVHGCFWHQHPGCPAAKRPASGTEYWNSKLDRNVARDAKNISALSAAGWQIVVVWECETKDRAKLLAHLQQNLHRPK